MRILVVGATQGIGKATALEMGRHGADLSIVGRSKERGQQVLQELQALRQGQDQFLTLDVTKILEVRQFCARLKQDPFFKDGLDGLVLCAGGLNYGPRRETSEGIEVTLAQNYLSRFALIHDLMPLLEKRQGRVVHCLGANQSDSIDAEDWELKRSKSMLPFFLQAASQHGAMGDLMVKEFSKRYPKVGVYHYFPGIVNTNGPKNNNFPWIVQFASSVVMPLIAKSPDLPSKVIREILIQSSYANKNGAILDEHGNEVQLKQFLRDPELGKRLWEFSISQLAKFEPN
ncbi:hypothetical protein EDD86DRAFT_68823 [Gorgonomyces haynaldii]|nr:hypothetical protein EDD86DRAFT_68823 [Gorgonomyces haynaldii]